MAEGAWPAHYNDGRVAAFHAATASLESDGLAIDAQDGARLALWPYREIRLLGGAAGEARLRLARVDSAERLTILSPDALAQLEPRCTKFHRSIAGRPEWRLIALWASAAVAALVILFWLGVPFLARHSSQFMSPRLEAELGNRAAETIIRLTTAGNKEGAPAECDAPAGLAALATLAAPLTQLLTLRNPPRIRVVNSPTINALALPGGQILLFKGLLDFAEGPNEIAGVLGHELGHLALDHPTTLMIERGAAAFVIGLIAGDVFGVSVMGGIAATTLDATYGREAEDAADHRGSELMAAAELDQRPMSDFFTRLVTKQLDGDIPIAFLRSHPPSEERAKLFRSVPAGGRSALDTAQWQTLRGICGEPG